MTGAHFDHCLRGEESGADAEFCKNLCERLGVAFRTEKRDVAAFASREKTGTEDAARKLRYDFLKRVSDERGFAAILTGHTADDQAETVLANFFRGSKLRGLSGIPKENGRILRPFLELKKSTLLAYLEELGQDYRTDSSNADPAYLRNRIRNRIVPEIETFNPGISSTVSRFAQYAFELDEYLANEVFAYLDAQKEPKTFEIADFARLTTFFKKEVLSRLYAEANEGGVGLSEGMVSEMLRFCSADF
ncbi:MAG: tRNA lysidine(34) synthetase TilS [Patescibacteria group bacterium]